MFNSMLKDFTDGMKILGNMIGEEDALGHTALYPVQFIRVSPLVSSE